MSLPEEFANRAEQFIDLFVKQFTATSHEIKNPSPDKVSEHPEDFDLGYSLGFLEGVISDMFATQYGRWVKQEENEEIRKMISKVTPKMKQLIFDAKRR